MSAAQLSKKPHQETHLLTIPLGEKLRERLDKLEALAESAALRLTTAATLDAVAGHSQLVTAHCLAQESPAATPSHEVTPSSFSSKPVVQSVVKSPYSSWDADATGQFVSFPWEPQQLTTVSDYTSSASDPSPVNSTKCIDPSCLIRNRGLDIAQHCTTSVDCCCSMPHSHVISRGPDAFNRGDFRILTLGSTGADPYANNLRLETICTLAAVAALTAYIGISQDILCEAESLSPFFRPGAASADSPDTVRTVQRIFKTLKPDLRPSQEQITVPHHPYIDILPFPTLRKNLIRQRERIDEDAFCEDLLVGLVCWGGAGVGQKDREASTGYASTGTPWDARSWEARGWFVKKYWDLLGGEDGELVRQSEWWRGVRGEESLEVGVFS